MTNISIIPKHANQTDPRQLLYHYPSMSAIRYAKLSSNFYHWKMVEIAEELARIQNMLLVPSPVLHWRKKQDIEEKHKIKIGKHMYYLVEPEKLTKSEKNKLKEYIEGLNEGKKREINFKAVI